MIGQTLGHYIIVDKIGAGGMGVVYRARDSRLERDVALKVLPEGALSDPEARRRFRNEALALARLNHPNICAVFDFNTENGVDFLAMEYVPGESLDKRLRQSSVPLEQVTRLGAQFAAGLAAAHAQGVIHRDLKPGNLRLTSDGRLKILDFGLAKLFHPERGVDATQSLADTSSFSGTVPYMAPEQLRGELLDPRTDIYSAGAVLYEMATGEKCFPEPQLGKLIDAILNKTPRRPSELNRRVSPALEAILLKAMDRQPERRYQAAREMEIDFERLAAGQAVGATPSAMRAVRPLGAALLVILAVGAAIGWYASHRARREAASWPETGSTSKTRIAAIVQRRSVAILGFKNSSGDPSAAWLSTGLSEMLNTELAAGERLRTVSGENVSRMKRDLALTDTDSYASDTLTRIRQNLSSDVVVFGSYVVVPDKTGAKIRVDLRMQDTRTGETALVSETGDQSDLLELVARAGAKLRSTLKAPDLSTEDSSRLRATLPQNTKAAQLYAQGLDKLRVFESGAARDLLEEAVAADSQNAETHIALASAWGQLGYDVRARDEAKRAFDLSRQLSREQQLSIEGRYQQAAHNWPKTVEVYKALTTVFPDNPDYASQLVTALGFAGQAEAAMAALDRLRATIPETKDDPRIDLVEASTADHLSDFKREQAAAHRAAETARQRGERLTLARALLFEGWADENLGDHKQAIAVSLEARSTYDAVGDRFGVARAVHNLGITAMNQGQLDQAQSYFNQALEIRRPLQDNQGINRALGNLGRLAEMRGDLKAAEDYYQQSLSMAREIGDRGATSYALGNLAGIYISEAQPAKARRYMEDSLALSREIGDKVAIASNLANLGNLEQSAGNTASARKFYEESAAKFEEAGQKSGVAQVRVLLGSLLYEQGDHATAKSNYERALASAKEVGDAPTASDAESGLCNVARLDGDWNAARTHAENAVAAAQRGGDKKLLAQSYFSLGGALEGLGDLEGSQKAANDGMATARDSGDKNLIAVATFNLADLAFHHADLAGAQKGYEQALALHRANKNMGSIAETQLALAYVALERGQAARAAELAQRGANEAHRMKDSYMEGNAYLLLGRAALQQEQIETARKYFGQAASLGSISISPSQQLELAAWSAQADAAAGSGREALKKLQARTAELGPKASLNAQFQARLVAAELECKFGDAGAGRDQLNALQKDANSKNFLLIAQKAATATK
jgi:serine/threonine protein kinase/tetratricopeptide (TPR) repeat protein